MTNGVWKCRTCTARNDGKARYCDNCGEAHEPERTTAREPEFLPPWRRPGWVEPKDTDICTELDEHGNVCGKTARQHIEEFRAIVSKPGTVFTRPSQRDVAPLEPLDEERLEARRQLLARQAAQLRSEDEVAW